MTLFLFINFIKKISPNKNKEKLWKVIKKNTLIPKLTIKGEKIIFRSQRKIKKKKIKSWPVIELDY